jgi:arylsulfatase A
MNRAPRILAFVLALQASAALHAAEAKPNIVFILADDLGYGDVHCLGGARGRIPTPNLDRLASQGMTFSEAHACAAVCTPSRYGILTGRYNWRSYLQHGVLPDNRPPLITAGRLTAAALLQQHGYRTACIGKWHVGFTLEGVPQTRLKASGAPLGAVTRDGPVTRGFDEFFGFDRLTEAPTSVFENDRCTQLIKPVDLLPTFVRRANGFIANAAQAGQPFFLYLALNSPHTPLVPTKEWQGRSGLGAYGDYVMETDWAVGEVMAALEKSGVSDKTLVFFTSDNGCAPYIGVKGLEAKGHFPSEHRRGYKADIWDGGHRIPLIARWPGRVKPAATNCHTVCLVDFMATCVEILGAKLPDNAGEDSISMLPELLGTATKPSREVVVSHSIDGNFAIREGNWKLDLCRGSGGWSKGGDGALTQLYDMSKDVGERANEYTSHPEIVARLTELLEKYVADGRSTPGFPQTNDVKIAIHKKSRKDATEGAGK